MTAWERAGRPKPPRISGPNYIFYRLKFGTVSVHKNKSDEWTPWPWQVLGPDRFDGLADSHTEAVAVAQFTAQERSAA